MARKRQIILMRPTEDGSLRPMGTLDEVVGALAAYNTAPDGSDRQSAGTMLLHGPGMVAEAPTGLDAVAQLLVTLIDEDIAWPVLMRACRDLNWTMMDPESGRTFGPHA